MINNVKLKKFLKATVCKPLNLVNKIVPKDDQLILLHSGVKGCGYNLKPLKKHLLKNGYDQKYKIVCGVEDLKYADDDRGRVSYVTYPKVVWTFLRSRHVFYTAGQIPIKPSKKQIVIFIDHGAAALKRLGALSDIQNGDEFFFTYTTVLSPLYVPIVQQEYLCGPENIKINGEPATDCLYEETHPYDLGNFKKILYWMPTFRQSKYLNYDDSCEELLPMFEPEALPELNKKLKEYNFKLIVKLHPLQDLEELEKIDSEKLSNIELLSSEAFEAKGYDGYEMMKQADALLSDYSTTSIQFLHLDRPMGFVIPDIEEYKQKRGFVFEHPEDYMAGELIYTREELYAFFADLAAGIDKYREKRAGVRKQVYTYTDGKNTERALELGDIRLP